MEPKRPAIISLIRPGWTPTAIAKHLGVARNSVYKAKKAMAAIENQIPPPRKGPAGGRYGHFT